MKSELNISNLADYLSLHSRERPDSPALLHPVKKSFRDMDCDADKYAAGLLEKGVKQGSMVLIMIPLSYDFFVLTFALVRIGAIMVMIDPGMGLRAMAKALKGIHVDVFLGVSKAHLFRMLYPGSFLGLRLNIYTDFNPPGSGSGLKDIYSETTNKLTYAA
ncbi:MAG: AMP-binding protein, partial [Bacteroidales bacterium]|nr:AMP-binding protein [Bacteroidales bacterium]